MKTKLLLLALSITFGTANAQDFKERKNKNRLFVSYGLNRTAYDLSTLSMEGDGYDFSLTHFDANDGFSEYDFGKFNGKLGFFITDNISISVGYDNFTYKNIDDRMVKIDGEIQGGSFGDTYEGNKDVVRTSKDFLQYSYTKLNYVNLNVEINDDFWVSRNGKFAWSYYFGLGGGILLTESEVLLFGKDKPANTTPVVSNNGMNGFAGNASFGTRVYLGPIFLELGGKAGYMRSKEVQLDENNGLGEHTFVFVSGIASAGLSFRF